MSVSTARRAGRRDGGKRRFGRALGVVAFVALAVAAPAWATPSATVTLAPVGPESDFLTVTNTGSETITGYILAAGGEPVATNIVTGQICQFQNFIGTVRSCAIPVAPAASAQICFTGRAPELFPGLEMLIQPAAGELFRVKVSTSSAAPPCPVPHFGAGSGSILGTDTTPGSSSRPGSSGTHVTTNKGVPRWSRARCKSTYKAWTKKHQHATRSRKKAEAHNLHQAHGCSLSVLK
jgi:hypothetical protein